MVCIPPWMHPVIHPDAGPHVMVGFMSSGQWLSYEDAAELLRMTPDSARNKARRECWEKRIADGGKAMILVPHGAMPGSNILSPPRPQQFSVDHIREISAHLAQIDAGMGSLLTALDDPQHGARGSIDRLTGEMAAINRQLVVCVTEMQRMYEAVRARADAAEKRERLLRAKWLEAQDHVLEVDTFTQAPWWKLPIMKRPERLLAMFAPLSWIKARAQAAT